MEKSNIKYTDSYMLDNGGEPTFIAKKLTFSIEGSPDEMPEIINALLVPLHTLDENMFNENDRFIFAKIIKGLIPVSEQYTSLIKSKKQHFSATKDSNE